MVLPTINPGTEEEAEARGLCNLQDKPDYRVGTTSAEEAPDSKKNSTQLDAQRDIDIICVLFSCSAPLLLLGQKYNETYCNISSFRSYAFARMFKAYPPVTLQ